MCRYLPLLHLNQYAGSLDFSLENATHCCCVSRSHGGRLRHSLKMAAKASCRFMSQGYTTLMAGPADDRRQHSGKRLSGMNTPPRSVSLVESADVMQGNILVTFADGRCALYSAELLHEVFHDAEEVTLPGTADTSIQRGAPGDED